ncbi:MAG: GH116 family glycosyl hydrolase [Armatimonadota bacterium]
MVTINQQIQHKSGIPLGGIGTGSVEIRPDGLFHEWQIFNNGTWNPKYKNDSQTPIVIEKRSMDPGDLIFIARVKTSDGRTILRYLGLSEQIHNLYSFSWIRSVQSISFDGTFPTATLTYNDPELPVSIEAEIFSPFIPLESRISGTPGFYVHFNIKNYSPEPVEVSILGITRNPVGYDQDSRKPKNRLESIGDAKAIVLGVDGLKTDQCSTGDMTFAALGGDVTYITGAYEDDRKGFHLWMQEYGIRIYSFLHQFRENGSLPNLNAEVRPELPSDFNTADLSDDERKALLDQLMQHPLIYDIYHRIAAADPDAAGSAEVLGKIADSLAHINGNHAEWGLAALSSRAELAPEAESSVLFTTAWYFPNHISPTEANIGHAYENWFENSLSVCKFMLDNYSDIYTRTMMLPESIHNSSIPTEAADAITAQLSIMTKCTWWTRDGLFGVWEGLGCCGFHTTDITYQGSFPIISLFPELQKTQMIHGANFQREDGRVHHMLAPDLYSADNQYDRVDMNQQFVMLTARDYLWTGDRAYLDKLWPHIIKAMESTSKIDTDGDGLPDSDTRRSTYDAWHIKGCPSYVSGLWLAALRAASRLAVEVGDMERAKSWQATYDKGVKSFEDKLWNGEYYVLFRDGDELDECCMSDQMSGDWFNSTSGWEHILDPERIKTALGSIVRQNFREGEGLINASYPPDKKRNLATSDNFQAEAPWTGIEYTVASLLISYGMVADGLAIVKDIHDRYIRAGRYWDHIECGGHYYRAMSSWTLMIAFSGFRWDQPAGFLSFTPAIDQPACEYPFFTSNAWGTYWQENDITGRTVTIEISSGEMTIRELSLPKLSGFEDAEVLIGGESAECKFNRCGKGIQVEFSKPVTLTEEVSLVITA